MYKQLHGISRRTNPVFPYTRTQCRTGVFFKAGLVCLGLAAAFFSHSLRAQETANVTTVQALDGPELPDAPSAFSSSTAQPEPLSLAQFSLAQSGQNAGNGKVFPRTAGRYDTVILPGQVAPRLSVHDEVIYGIKDSISPFSIIGWVASAGYSQAVDSSPNYGVLGNTRTGKSFGQRLGASAARASSETIFTESILAPILHEDPRYYKQGRSRSFGYRVSYSATRSLFTRTDGGRSTINFAGLGGNLAGAGLTNAYYPAVNRGLGETLYTFAGSVGGSSLGFVVSEFLPGILETVHLKRRVE